MSSRLLSFSLGLNLVLLGATVYWVGKSKSSGSAPVLPGTETVAEIKNQGETRSDLVPVAATPLRWDQLESKDYLVYVASLRKAGCPDAVLRRIIGGELRELYTQKAFALTQKFQREFWEIAAAENVHEYFNKRLRSQVETLCKEPDALLKQLVGDAPPASTAKADESRMMDFLPAAKQEQLRRLAERYEVLLRAVERDDLSPQEKADRQTQLHQEEEAELAQILSPEELAEYQLRHSSAADEVQELYGMDFSETELHKLAKVIDDYAHRTSNETVTDSETLEQSLQAVLGPERFTNFNRARSASYRELYKLAADFGQPPQTAAEIFDLRLKSEQRCEEIRVDKNRSVQEKQALLDDLEEQVEQTVAAKLGTDALQSYKARGGRWINSLGRL